VSGAIGGTPTRPTRPGDRGRPRAQASGEARDATALLALPAATIAHELGTLPLEEAARLLHGIVAAEEALTAENRLPAYADKLAPIVEALEPGRRIDLVAALPPEDAVLALRGGFRTVSTAVRTAVFAGLPPDRRGALLDALAHGWDGPREAVALLRAVPAARAQEALAAASPSGRAALTTLLAHDDAHGTAVDVGGAADAAPPSALAVELAAAPPAEAAAILARVGPEARVAVVEALPAPIAAAVLTELARADAAGAAATLAGLAEFLRDEAGEPVLFRARGAAVLERLDPDDPAAGALLAAVAPPVLRALLARCDARTADAIGARTGLGPVPHAVVRHPPLRAAGVRRARALHGLEDVGGRHVRIEERFTTTDGAYRMRVDLLELRAGAVRLEARRAAGVGEGMAIDETVRRLGDSRDVAPSLSAFADVGLVRLADATAEAGALGGINGTFYFDFGHIINARDLEMDLDVIPGLRFGDPIGWYVEDGREISPAMFSRAALVVTDDDAIHLRRVGLLKARLPGGRTLRWAQANGARTGAAVLYTGLWGFRTDPDPGYVDVSVAGGRVHEIVDGGGAAIPLTGFVVSLPREQAATLLEGVATGDPVHAVSDFPVALGRPRYAMACGPLLVRDGQVDLDLAAEELGEKDSSTLPFSLARSVDRFRGARSFVALAGDKVVLGAVSGVTLGSGTPRVSAGATFGELAQLCADLGLEQAMALDGGGSTSVVATVGRGPDRRVEVLNVPTGGADVPEGHERFINTHLLAFPS